MNTRSHSVQFSALAFLSTSLTAAIPLEAESAPIRVRGAEAELSIYELSERAIEIVLAPIDANSGEARPAPPSSVLVEQQRKLHLRRRELGTTEEFALGKLRVRVTSEPLIVSILDDAGKLIQELKLDAAGDGSMSFRADAPVLGMGEGAQQLDRRGARYTMKDGWGAWDRPTFGSWVAVPLLIGTDGWALTNELHTGSSELTRAVDLETLPLYVRAGAILPLDPVRQYAGESKDEPVTIGVYTGKDGDFHWYEDDGASLGYLNDKFTWTRLRWDDAARRLTIEPDSSGGAQVPPRDLVVELVPSGEKKSVRYDGEHREIKFEK